MAEKNSSAPLKTAEGAAPSNNLPSWEECQLRVSNSEFIAKRIAEGGYGAEHDSKLATELHRFIHEYDDADSYRSAWFRHRLEKLLHEVAAQAVEAQAPAAVAVPTDFELRERWRAAGGSFHGPCVETGTMPEEQLLPFLRDLAATPSLPATEDSSAGDQVEAVHPDDAAVDALVAMMKAKLAKQRAKGYGGWNTQECSQQRLSDMLRDHVAKGDPVDVANFCAFLVARGEGIQAEVQPKTAELPKGVAQFTKKPVTINAIQWDGKNLYEVISFTQGVPNTRSERAQDAWDDYAKIVEREGLHIDTLEGKMLANVGDWIIRGVKGEHYPCKPDIFAATYETATAPQAQPADALDAEIAKLKKAYQELGNMFHDQIVAQQAAWIEWQHGAGAEAGMQWIENGLCGPGHIPDEDEPYGTDAQAYFDANKSDPFPACHCGRPSNSLWMGKGFCSNAHYNEHRAAMAAAQEGGNAAKGS